MKWKQYNWRQDAEWRPWFAWHPVRLDDDLTWVWLEYVARFRFGKSWHYTPLDHIEADEPV